MTDPRPPRTPARREPAFPSPGTEDAAQEIARLRSLTLDERGEMIRSACRAAALIQRGRMQSGLSPARPVPWPPSTVEFLRRHAPNGREG